MQDIRLTGMFKVSQVPECHYKGNLQMTREISAGGVVVRQMRGRCWLAAIEPAGRSAAGGKPVLALPKGLVEPGESALAAARREFKEETGFDLDASSVARDLGERRLPSGKRLHVWAIEGDCDPAALRSNTFEMQWPPRMH